MKYRVYGVWITSENSEYWWHKGWLVWFVDRHDIAIAQAGVVRTLHVGTNVVVEARELGEDGLPIEEND